MRSLRLAGLAGAGLVAAVLLTNPGGSRASPLLYFVHTDHLNAPRLIADQNQTTVWRWDQANRIPTYIEVNVLSGEKPEPDRSSSANSQRGGTVKEGRPLARHSDEVSHRERGTQRTPYWRP
jgi:hypothetical protein